MCVFADIHGAPSVPAQVAQEQRLRGHRRWRPDLHHQGQHGSAGVRRRSNTPSAPWARVGTFSHPMDFPRGCMVLRIVLLHCLGRVVVPQEVIATFYFHVSVFLAVLKGTFQFDSHNVPFSIVHNPCEFERSAAYNPTSLLLRATGGSTASRSRVRKTIADDAKSRIVNSPTHVAFITAHDEAPKCCIAHQTMLPPHANASQFYIQGSNEQEFYAN